MTCTTECDGGRRRDVHREGKGEDGFEVEVEAKVEVEVIAWTLRAACLHQSEPCRLRVLYVGRFGLTPLELVRNTDVFLHRRPI